MTTNENNPVVESDAPVGQDLTSPEQLAIESGLDDAPVAPETPATPEVETQPDGAVQGNAMGAQGAPQELPGQQPLPEQQPQATPTLSPQQIQQMQQRNTQMEEQQFFQGLGKAAHQYKSNLEDQGVSPDVADGLATNWIKEVSSQRERDKQFADMMGNQAGSVQATLHFAQKYGFIDANSASVFNQLLQAQSPADMESMAKKMQSDRAKDARIAELEQGTVPPQNFDNSQGSPDASASNDRLIDAYNNGDRSPAAVEAVRRMTFGS